MTMTQNELESVRQRIRDGYDVDLQELAEASAWAAATEERDRLKAEGEATRRTEYERYEANVAREHTISVAKEKLTDFPAKLADSFAAVARAVEEHNALYERYRATWQAVGHDLGAAGVGYHPSDWSNLHDPLSRALFRPQNFDPENYLKTGLAGIGWIVLDGTIYELHNGEKANPALPLPDAQRHAPNVTRPANRTTEAEWPEAWRAWQSWQRGQS